MMHNITSTAELKNAIEILEAEQSSKRQLLKEQLYHTSESLKPINLLRDTLDDLTSASYQIESILTSATGLISGLLSNKIVKGSSGNKYRKLAGSIVQMIVTNLAAQHSETIRAYGHYFIQKIFGKN
ncbi:MAG TPA: hypothetical protein VMV77_14390 [Bacteroidales bacterium]|nr:hypothetical protein [Bacteroidales bacterium]